MWLQGLAALCRFGARRPGAGRSGLLTAAGILYLGIHRYIVPVDSAGAYRQDSRNRRSAGAQRRSGIGSPGGGV